MIRDLQPTVIITTPSWAIRLAEAGAEIGLDLKNLPLKKMWITGEGCSPSFRNRVEALWGVKANFYYGSLECGGLGIECDDHCGYHLNMAHAIVEIIDSKTGEVLEPGEIGEIVITCPQRVATPIIRYRTRDLGYIETETCSCGVSTPRLFLRGRLVDQITIQGVSFSPIYLEEFLMKNPEVGNWFEFIIDSSDADKLNIRCELSEGMAPSEELADSLASKMEFSVGIPCQFEFVEKMPRPNGKTVRVVKKF
jgi:phenylacetate-CoA ligase